jgi:hypothetical protein
MCGQTVKKQNKKTKTTTTTTKKPNIWQGTHRWIEGLERVWYGMHGRIRELEPHSLSLVHNCMLNHIFFSSVKFAGLPFIQY